jgi:hypothetical protein
MLTALDEAENAVDDARAALFDERHAWQAQLDARPRACLYGPTIPVAGFAAVDDFVKRSGLKPGLIRAYPGGTNSLSGVRTAITKYPGAAIVYNVHVASKNLTQTQIDTLVKAIEVEAAKVPRFVLCPDAEPDRPRTYNTAQFIAAFEKVHNAITRLGPHIELSLSMTGWDFASRIGAYDPIISRYSTLTLDPYFEPVGSGGTQGSVKNLADAVVFCEATDKRFGLSEWGATNGAPTLLADGLAWIRQHPICELSCYYIETDPSFPIRGGLTSPEAYAVYKAGAAQP